MLVWRGTEGDDVQSASWDATFFGLGGNDHFYYEGGPGVYTIIFDGGDGDDQLDLIEMTGSATLIGGAGRDTISGGSLATHWIDAGSGSDKVHLIQPVTATVTLGDGADELRLAPSSTRPPVVVTDFQTGPSGDILSFFTFYDDLGGKGWDGASNPFVTGHARLIQRGADAILQWDFDGAADGYALTDIVRFESVQTDAFTALNLLGWAPHGGPEGIVSLGSPGDDSYAGSRHSDSLSGGAGDDSLMGGAGDDRIDGGEGVDVAVYAGRRADYEVRATATAWVVSDLRTSGTDGADSLRSIEAVSFGDQRVTLPAPPAAGSPIGVATANVLQLSAAGSPLAADLSQRLAAGTLTQAQAVAELVKAADATTSVATLAYQFFTGKIPSAGGMDYLVSPTGPNPNNLNAPYYQDFNLENRYINFAVNLGREGEGRASFEAEYGGLSLSAATKKAYGEIFGAEPTDAKVAALLSGGRDLYFEAYGRDGLDGLGTKAAMVGWLLAEAEKADLGMYARANAAFLTDLADGADFAVDLVGTYGKPEYVHETG